MSKRLFSYLARDREVWLARPTEGMSLKLASERPRNTHRPRGSRKYRAATARNSLTEPIVGICDPCAATSVAPQRQTTESAIRLQVLCYAVVPLDSWLRAASLSIKATP